MAIAVGGTIIYFTQGTAFTYLIVADAALTWTAIIAGTGVVVAMNIGNKMDAITGNGADDIIMAVLAVRVVISRSHGLNKMVVE